MSSKILSVEALIPLYITIDGSNPPLELFYIDYMKGQIYDHNLKKVGKDFNKEALNYLREKQFTNYYKPKVPTEALAAAIKEVNEIRPPDTVEPPSRRG